MKEHPDFSRCCLEIIDIILLLHPAIAAAVVFPIIGMGVATALFSVFSSGAWRADTAASRMAFLVASACLAVCQRLPRNDHNYNILINLS